MGSEVMTIELSDPTGTLLQEIAAKRYTRNTVAKTYALAIRGEVPVDWRRVNVAIIARWSPYALEWIKSRAWSGKCFEDKKGRAGVMGDKTVKHRYVCAMCGKPLGMDDPKKYKELMHCGMHHYVCSTVCMYAFYSQHAEPRKDGQG